MLILFAPVVACRFAGKTVLVVAVAVAGTERCFFAGGGALGAGMMGAIFVVVVVGAGYFVVAGVFVVGVGFLLVAGGLVAFAVRGGLVDVAWDDGLVAVAVGFVVVAPCNFVKGFVFMVVVVVVVVVVVCGRSGLPCGKREVGFGTDTAVFSGVLLAFAAGRDEAPFVSIIVKSHQAERKGRGEGKRRGGKKRWRRR
jgi:hypothetical protein